MIVLGSNSSSGSYQIANSVRLRRSASAYLDRTFSSSTNRKTWTFSCWFKRGAIDYSGGDFPLLSAQATSYYDSLRINGDYTLHLYYDGGFGASTAISGTPVFRDPSAWYHIVVSQDTTQATEANRLKIWINGVQQTLTGIPAQNYQSGINNSVAHHIGKQYSQSEYWDGYIAETHFIDGQALTHTSFGETDTITGVWNPKKYTGTYGTNGCYLKFNDTSSFGKDSSGNSNTWTSNNISNITGVTYDSMVDTPTNYGSDTGAGGEVRGNYCTFNPLDFKGSPSAPTLANANLRMSGVSTASWRASASTIAIPNQKIYCEITLNGAGSTSNGPRSFGVIGTSSNIGASGVGFSSNTGWGIAATTGANDGAWTNGAKTTLTGITTASGTVYQIAVDATVGSGSNKIRSEEHTSELQSH